MRMEAELVEGRKNSKPVYCWALVFLLSSTLLLGANTALSSSFVLMSEMEGRLVEADGAPAANVKLVRTWEWAWANRSGQDETETDEEGRFVFPKVTGRSWSARIFPHEPDILQRIHAQTSNGEIRIWSARKANYRDRGELSGRPLRVLCSLESLPGPENERLFASLCIFDPERQ